MSSTQGLDNAAWSGEGDPEIEGFYVGDARYQDDYAQPFYERLRATCPVAHSNRFDGFWILTRYQDAFEILQQPELFSSWPNAIPANAYGSQHRMIPVEIDPPDHKGYRKILAPLFTANRLRPLEEAIRVTARELVTELAGRGSCNYVADFGKRLPAAVFLHQMGWPIEDSQKFSEWSEMVLHPGTDLDESEKQAQRLRGRQAVYEYFGQKLREADRCEPSDDPEAGIISWLRAARFNGERPLSEQEVLDIIFLLLNAGLDTTQSVLGLATEYLATHDEARRELVADPSKMRLAVEEFVRVFAPTIVVRNLTADTTVQGRHMKRGDQVLVALPSACMDEAEFPSSNQVDLAREPNRHIAFGAGIHRCIGSELARINLRVALDEWHREIPEYHITPGSKTTRHMEFLRQVSSLSLTYPAV